MYMSKYMDCSPTDISPKDSSLNGPFPNGHYHEKK